MGSDLVQWRTAIGCFFCRTHSCTRKQFKYWFLLKNILDTVKLLIYNVTPNLNKILLLTNTKISELQFSIIFIILVILSGDVETNPGPNNVDQTPAGCISMAHLNIRSIRNKIDFIQLLIADFQIACFTETHLSDNISNDHLAIDGFIFTKEIKQVTLVAWLPIFQVNWFPNVVMI